MSGWPYIVFNGVDSRDVGVLIGRLPDFHRPKRNVTYTPVAGRSGRLGVDEGGYDSYQTTMEVHCNGVALLAVYGWLSGSGWLTSSNEPDRRVYVDLYQQISDNRLRLHREACYDTLTLTVQCQPYRYFTDDPKKVFTRSPDKIINPGTAESLPRITIEGKGDVTLTVGDVQMDFSGLTDGVVIDCELQDCINLTGTALLNTLVTMDEDFPALAPGGNTIAWTGNVTRVTVERRCRDL